MPGDTLLEMSPMARGDPTEAIVELAVARALAAPVQQGDPV